MAKLFNIVQPDCIYFGEKDAQRLVIVKILVKELNMLIEIIGHLIVREEDGLDKSSRNTYLSEAEGKAAPILSQALQEARSAIEGDQKSYLIIR